MQPGMRSQCGEGVPAAPRFRAGRPGIRTPRHRSRRGRSGRTSPKTSRDDAHVLWCRARALHGALDRGRDAAGSPSQQLKTRFNRKAEGQPNKAEHGGMTRDCGGNPGHDTMHEPVEPGRIDALQRTRYLQVKHMARFRLTNAARQKPRACPARTPSRHVPGRAPGVEGTPRAR